MRCEAPSTSASKLVHAVHDLTWFEEPLAVGHSVGRSAWPISRYFSGTSDYAAIHVAAKSVAGCQIPRCRHEKIADG